jgi:hypothetical protein
MRLGYLGIALIYLAVAGAGVTLHWYIGTQHSVQARRLREWFLYRDPQTGQQRRPGLVDVLLPAVIFGLAAGTIGSRWRPREVICCIMLLSAGGVCLLPLYAAFLPQARFWWWGDTVEDRVTGMFFASLNLGGLCGGFALVGCYLAQSFHRHRVEFGGQEVVMTTYAILRLLEGMETEAVERVVLKDTTEGGSGALLVVQKVECRDEGRPLLILSFRSDRTWLLSLSTEVEGGYVTCEAEGVSFQVLKRCLLDPRVHQDRIQEVVRGFLESHKRPEGWLWIQCEGLP